MAGLTVIQLNNQDIEKFKIFMQFYDQISCLIDAKVFEQKKASITLDFDHTGTLQTIRRADLIYSKKFDE